MDGLIQVTKPSGYTSHDIVAIIKKSLKIPKAGHFGTLDPFATGLLLVALGKATRLFPFFSKLEKVYQGRIRLGWATDTYDGTGQPTSQESQAFPPKKDLVSGLSQLEGELLQIPPLFSAKKYKGKPSYKFARQKQEIKLSACQISVQYFRLDSYQPPFLDFEVKCSSGTYIRSLAHDLGQNLGCGAHLDQLKRTEIGPFLLQDSFTPVEISQLFLKNRVTDFLIPMEMLLPHFPKVMLKDAGAELIKNGNTIGTQHISKIISERDTGQEPNDSEEETFRLFNPKGHLIAFARLWEDRESLHPFLVIDTEDSNN